MRWNDNTFDLLKPVWHIKKMALRGRGHTSFVKNKFCLFWNFTVLRLNKQRSRKWFALSCFEKIIVQSKSRTSDPLIFWAVYNIESIIQREFNNLIHRTLGLTHKLEDYFNNIFQYNHTFLQCMWPTFFFKNSISLNKSCCFVLRTKPL